MFKEVCSSLTDRPSICSAESLDDRAKYLPKEVLEKTRENYIQKETERRYQEYDKALVGMDRRARTAEVVLALVIAVIINCACISYCKMYNKKKNTD